LTGRVEIRPAPPYEDVLHVTSNLRERDRQEIFALYFNESPEEVARDAVGCGEFRWGAYLDGEPVAMFGGYPRWPGVWSMWAYGTDKWPHVVRAITRQAVSFIVPAIYHSGAHRMDAFAYAGHTDARQWLQYLGADLEFRLEKWGKNCEDFVCYRMTREGMARLAERADQRLRNRVARENQLTASAG
jgi:hypothetical protein